MDRDLEVHRLTACLRTLRRFILDLCLGRIVGADGDDPVYMGRLGLTDKSGRRLLVDWRSPAAEPFFAATHASPMGPWLAANADGTACVISVEYLPVVRALPACGR